MSILYTLLTALICNSHVLAAGEDFSIVVLPDTQNYSQSHPDIVKSQAQWIVDNANTLQIKMVLQAGDVVNKGASQPVQWQNAKNALGIIDNAGIPLFIAMGNHDYDDQSKTRATTAFNTYFGSERYMGRSWFGGTYEANKAENVYGFVNAGGRQYLVMVLEFGPREAVVRWANEIIAQHPQSDVIILTHNYLYNDDTLSGINAQWNPHTYGIGADAFDGEQLWNGLVSKHKNIIIVQNGHILGDGLGRRTDMGLNGNMVHQILANYQMLPNGGSGYLRMMRFRPAAGVIEVKTYSPYLNSYLTDAQNEFSLPYTTADTIWPQSTVRGQVIDANSRLGVADAFISIKKDGTPYSNITTDTSGKFTMLLPVGAYSFNISQDNHMSAQVLLKADVVNHPYDLEIPLVPVSVFAGVGKTISGTLAEGTSGDIIMQNQKLSMVVALEYTDSQLADATKGKPIDFAAVGMPDGIDWINLPYLSPRQPQGSNAWKSLAVQNTSVQTVENTPEKVVVAADGKYALTSDVTVRTTYTLQPGEEWVHALTRVSNNGTQPLTLWAGDVMDNDDGMQFSYVPGKGVIAAGAVTFHAQNQPWIAQYGDADQVYAVVYGKGFTDFATYGSNLWIMTQKEITIPAGGYYDISRYLVVASTTGYQNKIDPILQLYEKRLGGI